MLVPHNSRRTRKCSSCNVIPVMRAALATAPGHSCHGSTRGVARDSTMTPVSVSTTASQGVLVDDRLHPVASHVGIAEHRVDADSPGAVFMDVDAASAAHGVAR